MSAIEDLFSADPARRRVAKRKIRATVTIIFGLFLVGSIIDYFWNYDEIKELGLAQDPAHWAIAATAMVGLLCLAQLLLLFHIPRRWVPSAADRAAGDRLVSMLAGVDGTRR